MKLPSLYSYMVEYEGVGAETTLWIQIMMRIFSLLFIHFISSISLGNQVLKKPEKSQTMEANTLAVGAMLIHDSNIIYLPDDSPEVFVAQLHGKKNSSLKFYDNLKTTRVNLDPKNCKTNIMVRVVSHRDKLFLFDGFELVITVLIKIINFIGQIPCMGYYKASQGSYRRATPV